MILTTFLSATGAPFVVERQYVRQYSLTWWNMCSVSTGQTFDVMEQQGFGGYHVHFKFKDGFWNWNSSAWAIEDVFEDFYALPPDLSAPITCPDVIYRVVWAHQFNGYLLDMGLSGNAGITIGQRFIPAPSTWYRKFALDTSLDAWYINNVNPDVVLPQPSC